jgi:cyclopropane fatty-acyl-phospholipid synthase-like methyltransferase
MEQNRAFAAGDRSAVRWFAAQSYWWDSHYVQAVDDIVDFLGGDGLSLDGQRVLDLGCGDGILAAGLATRTQAQSVIGLDLQPVDTEFLATKAEENGVYLDTSRLTFAVSQLGDLGIPDSSVDVVISWSVFEHVSNVGELLTEIRRVLVSEGLLFIQIWPLFNSAHGSHLWPWFDTEPFPHLRLDPRELETEMLDRTGDTDLTEAMLDLYASCNRLTLDELGAALNETGFYISKVETEVSTIHIPPEAQRIPLSQLTTSGVKLTAVNFKY